MNGSRREPWTAATGLLLVGVSTFQVCLASGLPWGTLAYGGRHPGRLPGTYRSASAVAAAAYGVTAMVIASHAGPPPVRRRLVSAVTGFMVLGTGLNLASRSRAERLLWAPVAALTAVSAWQAHREIVPPDHPRPPRLDRCAAVPVC